MITTPICFVQGRNSEVAKDILPRAVENTRNELELDMWPIRPCTGSCKRCPFLKDVKNFYRFQKSMRFICKVKISIRSPPRRRWQFAALLFTSVNEA
jgi:hypothetical protein